MKFVIVILLCLLLVPVVSAEIYTWTDDQGQVHYSDQPPSGDQDSQQLPGDFGAISSVGSGLRPAEEALLEALRIEREARATRRQRRWEIQQVLQAEEEARRAEEAARREEENTTTVVVSPSRGYPYSYPRRRYHSGLELGLSLGSGNSRLKLGYEFHDGPDYYYPDHRPDYQPHKRPYPVRPVTVPTAPSYRGPGYVPPGVDSRGKFSP